MRAGTREDSGRECGNFSTLRVLGRFLAPYLKPLKHFFVSWATDLLASLKGKPKIGEVNK